MCMIWSCTLKTIDTMTEQDLKYYYNKVEGFTAVCKSTQSWLRGNYDELEVGKTYRVTHIGVQRSCTEVVLEEFPDKDYLAGVFDLYRNGERIGEHTLSEKQYLAPYLRERYRQNRNHLYNRQIERFDILQHLKEVERDFDVKVLLAVESGSRAWGFESRNSDWDVRFIYVHKPEWYFSVEEKRDVIEHVYPDDVDLAGWELRKALSLLCKNNPSVLEWLASPKVYYADEEFVQRIKEIADKHFNPIRSMYHYNHVYNKHNERYLQKEGYPMKRFLYYLRGILACKWIENNQTLPPIPFEELVSATVDEVDMRAMIDELVRLKKRGTEHDMQAVPNELVDYARNLANYYNERVETFRPEMEKTSSEALDTLLFDMVHREK